jgi:hypothetical protein
MIKNKKARLFVLKYVMMILVLIMLKMIMIVLVIFIGII